MTRTHHTLSLEGLALDYALAMTLNWTEPFYGVGKIRYVEEDNYMMMEQPDPDECGETTLPHHFNHYTQWAPQLLKSIIAQLLIEHRVGVSWDGDQVTVLKNGSIHTGTNLGTTLAQLLVATKFGLLIELPENIN